MDALVGLLPVTLLLACPAMMIFCFWGMRRTSGSTDAAAAPMQNLTRSDQVNLLQTRLDSLQAEQSAIAAQLSELRSSDSSRVAEATIFPRHTQSHAPLGERLGG